jgi:hypothetical protein
MMPGRDAISRSHSGTGLELKVCFSNPLILVVNLEKVDGLRRQSASSAADACEFAGL